MRVSFKKSSPIPQTDDDDSYNSYNNNFEKTTLLGMLVTINNENEPRAFILISVFPLPQLCFIVALINFTIIIVMIHIIILYLFFVVTIVISITKYIFTLSVSYSHQHTLKLLLRSLQMLLLLIFMTEFLLIVAILSDFQNCIVIGITIVNSLGPSDAYMRH